jgi:hypothetical protein
LEDKIKIDLREIGWDGMDWIDLEKTENEAVVIRRADHATPSIPKS